MDSINDIHQEVADKLGVPKYVAKVALMGYLYKGDIMKNTKALQMKMNTPHYEKEKEVFHNNRKNSPIVADLEDAQYRNGGSLRRTTRKGR